MRWSCALLSRIEEIVDVRLFHYHIQIFDNICFFKPSIFVGRKWFDPSPRYSTCLLHIPEDTVSPEEACSTISVWATVAICQCFPGQVGFPKGFQSITPSVGMPTKSTKPSFLMCPLYQYCKCVHLWCPLKIPIECRYRLLRQSQGLMYCLSYSYIWYLTVREHQHVHPSAERGPVSIQTGRTSGPRGHGCLPLYRLLRRMPSEQDRIFIPPESVRRSARIGLVCLFPSHACKTTEDLIWLVHTCFQSRILQQYVKWEPLLLQIGWGVLPCIWTE